MSLKNCISYLFALGLLFAGLLLPLSCSSRGSDAIHANVLLYWPTDENDPVFKEWSKIAEKEIRRQGIQGDIQVHFAHATERYESTERPMLNELILRLRSEGRMPDLILAYGDAVRWLVLTNESQVTSSIPVVCFGLHFRDYLPYQYELLTDNYNGGRKGNMVDIMDSLNVRENLQFADSIIPHAIKSLYRPEYPAMYPHRLITLLDVPNLWTDRLRYIELNRQMDELEGDLFYSNLTAKTGEGSLRAISRDKIIFSCRSVMSPSWNNNPEVNQMSTTWAFYPQKSSNFYLQSKHDNKTRAMAEGPSFMPYFTMIAADFLTNGKCIGGYFCPFENQIEDAVTTGIRMLRGEKAEEIGTLEHKATFNLNWDVLRPFGLDVNEVPEQVRLFNVTFKDRKPVLYNSILKASVFLVAWIFIVSSIIILRLTMKSRSNRARFKIYANESLHNQKMLEELMENIEFRTWEQSEPSQEYFKHISASDFFIDKLKSFIKTEQPGNYSTQVYCSFDGEDPHWYEIRMTVSENSVSGIERKGIIINNDKQKELEAIAAETNRLITTAKTREGFIASMNHEIRTPLNSIIGYSQVLSMPGMDIDPNEFKEFAEAINDNSFILKSTVLNILTATRISKSRIEPDIETIVLGDYLCPGTESKPLPEHLMRHHIRLERGPADLKVQADRKLLNEVLVSLIANAAKFSDTSQEITVGWDRSAEEGLSAEIWVKDRGIGIDARHMDMIFERFFKVDSFTPGCGLGLYISKAFAELMGGHISVESKPGEGSIFKIELR